MKSIRHTKNHINQALADDKEELHEGHIKGRVVEQFFESFVVKKTYSVAYFWR